MRAMKLSGYVTAYSRCKHNTNLLMQIFVSELTLSSITWIFLISLPLQCTVSLKTETAKSMQSFKHLVSGFSPVRSAFDLRSGHVEFVMHKINLGQVYFKHLNFSPASSPSLIYKIIKRLWVRLWPAVGSLLCLEHITGTTGGSLRLVLRVEAFPHLRTDLLLGWKICQNHLGAVMICPVWGEAKKGYGYEWAIR
jgi:hypothetical protein